MNDRPSVERWIQVPGGRIWSRVVGNSGGIPLLVLHGGPGMPSDYLASLDALADERRVVLYDQLGCGRSDRPSEPGTYYTVDRFVEQVELLREALDLSDVHLLGQSWGGFLAIKYAATQPPGLHSAIYASPLVDVEAFEADAERLKRGLGGDVYAVLVDHERRGSTACPEYAAANLTWWRRHVCRLDPFPAPLEKMITGLGTECYETMWGPSEFFCSGSLKGGSALGELSSVTCPQLFTCGRFDETTPESTGRFAASVAAPLVVFEQSAHMAHLEETDAYVRCLRSFLAEVERTGRAVPADWKPPAADSSDGNCSSSREP